MIKIISIDDHLLFFEGLKAIMEKEQEISLSNGYKKELNIPQMIESDKPDIILLDVHLPGKSGIALAKEIKNEYPAVKIIMLSMEVDNTYLHELEATGIEAYISKEIEANQLLKIIRDVYNGNTFYLNDSVSIPNPTTDILSDNFNFTEREIEIYEYIKKGLTNQHIADLLYLSIWTVKTHRKNIKQKLSIKNGFKIPVTNIDEKQDS